MTNNGERIHATARALVDLANQDRRWWQFWKPKLTEARAIEIMRQALTGEKEPIEIYGYADGRVERNRDR